MRFSLFLAALVLSGCATIHKPFLYSAEKEGRKIVLLGTIHTGVSAYDLPGLVSEELSSSKVAFFETDFHRIQELLGLEGDKEAERLIINKLYFRDRGNAMKGPEPKLSEKLPKETWEAFKRRLSHYQPAILEEFNLNGALALLQEGQSVRVSRYEANSYNPLYGMDLRLFSWAKKQGLRTFRLDREDDVCKQELEAMNVKLIQIALSGADAESSLEVSRKLVEAYREGDEAKLRSLGSSLGEGLEDECLIDRRNREWAEKVGHFLMPGEKAFVAVGAMHLLSEKYPSLLQLLREQGYRVERMVP